MGEVLHADAEWSQLIPPPPERLSPILREELSRLKAENRQLHGENQALRKELHRASETQEVIEKVSGEIEKLLRVAMGKAAKFLDNHLDKLDRIHLTLAEGRFRFLFMLKTSEFDWELSDELGDLQADIIAESSFLPIDCMLVTGGFDNEQYLCDATLSTCVPGK